jgi:hypothetical protein
LQLCGGFASWKNQRVAFMQISYGADFFGFGAEGVKHCGVGGEVALNGEDSDFGCAAHEYFAVLNYVNESRPNLLQP